MVHRKLGYVDTICESNVFRLTCDGRFFTKTHLELVAAKNNITLPDPTVYEHAIDFAIAGLDSISCYAQYRKISGPDISRRASRFGSDANNGVYIVVLIHKIPLYGKVMAMESDYIPLEEDDEDILTAARGHGFRAIFFTLEQGDLHAFVFDHTSPRIITFHESLQHERFSKIKERSEFFNTSNQAIGHKILRTMRYLVVYVTNFEFTVYQAKALELSELSSHNSLDAILNVVSTEAYAFVFAGLRDFTAYYRREKGYEDGSDLLVFDCLQDFRPGQQIIERATVDLSGEKDIKWYHEDLADDIFYTEYSLAVTNPEMDHPGTWFIGFDKVTFTDRDTMSSPIMKTTDTVTTAVVCESGDCIGFTNHGYALAMHVTNFEDAHPDSNDIECIRFYSSALEELNPTSSTMVGSNCVLVTGYNRAVLFHIVNDRFDHLEALEPLLSFAGIGAVADAISVKAPSVTSRSEHHDIRLALCASPSNNCGEIAFVSSSIHPLCISQVLVPYDIVPSTATGILGYYTESHHRRILVTYYGGFSAFYDLTVEGGESGGKYLEKEIPITLLSEDSGVTTAYKYEIVTIEPQGADALISDSVISAGEMSGVIFLVLKNKISVVPVIPDKYGKYIEKELNYTALRALVLKNMMIIQSSESLMFYADDCRKIAEIPRRGHFHSIEITEQPNASVCKVVIVPAHSNTIELWSVSAEGCKLEASRKFRIDSGIVLSIILKEFSTGACCAVIGFGDGTVKSIPYDLQKKEFAELTMTRFAGSGLRALHSLEGTDAVIAQGNSLAMSVDPQLHFRPIRYSNLNTSVGMVATDTYGSTVDVLASTEASLLTWFPSTKELMIHDKDHMTFMKFNEIQSTASVEAIKINDSGSVGYRIAELSNGEIVALTRQSQRYQRKPGDIALKRYPFQEASFITTYGLVHFDGNMNVKTEKLIDKRCEPMTLLAHPNDPKVLYTGRMSSMHSSAIQEKRMVDGWVKFYRERFPKLHKEKAQPSSAKMPNNNLWAKVDRLSEQAVGALEVQWLLGKHPEVRQTETERIAVALKGGPNLAAVCYGNRVLITRGGMASFFTWKGGKSMSSFQAQLLVSESHAETPQTPTLCVAADYKGGYAALGDLSRSVTFFTVSQTETERNIWIDPNELRVSDLRILGYDKLPGVIVSDINGGLVFMEPPYKADHGSQDLRVADAKNPHLQLSNVTNIHDCINKIVPIENGNVWNALSFKTYRRVFNPQAILCSSTGALYHFGWIDDNKAIRCLLALQHNLPYFLNIATAETADREASARRYNEYRAVKRAKGYTKEHLNYGIIDGGLMTTFLGHDNDTQAMISNGSFDVSGKDTGMSVGEIITLLDVLSCVRY